MSFSFYVLMIAWATVSLLVAIVIFMWGVRTGQFQDSRRAALLPFDEETHVEPPSHSHAGRASLIFFAALIAVTLFATGYMLHLALVVH